MTRLNRNCKCKDKVFIDDYMELKEHKDLLGKRGRFFMKKVKE